MKNLIIILLFCSACAKEKLEPQHFTPEKVEYEQVDCKYTEWLINTETGDTLEIFSTSVRDDCGTARAGVCGNGVVKRFHKLECEEC